MKKLLMLLVLVFAVSCSDDSPLKPSIDYDDYYRSIIFKVINEYDYKQPINITYQGDMDFFDGINTIVKLPEKLPTQITGKKTRKINGINETTYDYVCIDGTKEYFYYPDNDNSFLINNYDRYKIVTKSPNNNLYNWEYYKKGETFQIFGLNFDFTPDVFLPDNHISNRYIYTGYGENKYISVTHDIWHSYKFSRYKTYEDMLIDNEPIKVFSITFW